MTKIVVRVMIEILGSPKKHVEEIINKIVKNIEKEENIKLLNGKTFEAKETKGLWSTFAEVELEFEKLDDLVGFCFDYMPSSVDFLGPKEIKVESNSLGQVLNDLLARLHQYDMLMKNLKAENIVLKRKKE